MYNAVNVCDKSAGSTDLLYGFVVVLSWMDLFFCKRWPNHAGFCSYALLALILRNSSAALQMRVKVSSKSRAQKNVADDDCDLISCCCTRQSTARQHEYSCQTYNSELLTTIYPSEQRHGLTYIQRGIRGPDHLYLCSGDHRRVDTATALLQ